MTQVLKLRHGEWSELWQSLADNRDRIDAPTATRRISPLVDGTLREILLRGYPEAADLLKAEPLDEAEPAERQDEPEHATLRPSAQRP